MKQILISLEPLSLMMNLALFFESIVFRLSPSKLIKRQLKSENYKRKQ